MASPTEIKSYERIVPMIYAYNTPGVTYNEGWTKIGYTDRQTVRARIDQQTQPHAKDRHERGGIPHASARIHVPQFLQSAIHVVDVSRLQP